MTRPTELPDPTRSAAARAGHERRARRKRLTRILGAALRRTDEAIRVDAGDLLLKDPEDFAAWIVRIAAEAAAEWDEPDLVGGSPAPRGPEPISIHELRNLAGDLLGLEADGDVDATVEITEERTDERTEE